MTNQDTAPQPIPCRHCLQPVHPAATKCPHCHERLTTTSFTQRAGKKLLALVGIGTAVLSLFFALKEGYFFIEKRQQQREAFAAHMNAAAHFLRLDNLDYAEASLNQALQINPNDKSLRLNYFLLRSRNLLREADYFGAQLPDTHLDTIPALITDGFSLIDNDFVNLDRARLNVSLARLLQYDRRWQTPRAVGELFAKARALAPNNADVAYWYGEWLLNQEPPDPQGLALIQEAVRAQPDNPVYWHALGRYQGNDGDYAAAFAALRRAIELRPNQTELQRIRAANEARYSLRRALLQAHDQHAITDHEFFGLDMDERVALVQFALAHGGSNRRFEHLAAELLHHHDDNAAAEPLLRKLLGDYDTRSPGETLALFAAVLEAQEKHAEAARVREVLAEKEERETFEEILETGYEDKHRYKVGLRVAKQNQGEGVEVIKAYEGYPFAKAGVQTSDRLLEFAHRKVTSLRSIWVPINDFAPGTDVPLKIQRGDETLSLTVVIE
mgnify:CR=1 FL=1